MSLTVTAPRDLERLRWRIWTLFFLNGLLFSTWAVLVPVFQERLNLQPVQLAWQLFAIMLGNFMVIPLARYGLQRFGLRPLTLASVALMALGLVALGLTTSPILTALLLLVYGVGFGAVDFAMNAVGGWVEEQLARPVMSGLHAAFSVGTLGGAALGALLLRLGVSFPLHLALVCLSGLGVGLLVSSQLPRFRSTPPEAGHQAVRLPLVLLLFAGFAAAICEGIINDWSSVYLRGQGMDVAQASWGFLAFSLTMVIGRVTGDRLTEGLGRTRVSFSATLLCVTGLALVILIAAPMIKVAGFALAGLGLSVLAPLAFSAAWGYAEARGIALMTATFYGGFLAGPPLTGFLVQHSSLSVTFLLPTVLLLVTLVLTLQRIYAPESKSTEPT